MKSRNRKRYYLHNVVRLKFGKLVSIDQNKKEKILNGESFLKMPKLSPMVTVNIANF